MNALVSIRRALGILAAAAAFCLSPAAQAAGEGVALDHFPMEKLTNLPALQDGAKTFVNYCLSCHSASMMRYNRLRDIGLTEDQIANNLIFTGRKVGDLMTVAMRQADAKEWFGALPPDLTVVARSRSSGAGSGSDWLYTFLRSFYRDGTRELGWNNAVFPNVGMPHVLWTLQGSRGAIIEEVKAANGDAGDGHGFTRTTITVDNQGFRSEKTEKIEGGHPHEGSTMTLTSAQGGSLSQPAYDETVANLVAYMTYMADPSAATRVRLGVWVLIFIGVLIILTWWLNREYWKDVK
jgi:ubiquinol-cytochrome c reductase cytochrome c1 subunit